MDDRAGKESKRIFNPGTDTLLLIVILLAGTVLRFYNYHLLPYSYDEFSALLRARFDNFSELIKFGVVVTDTHPPGVQVFMHYWIRLFGESEIFVKLPFILAGIASIYLVYKIGSSWFNTSVGLISASFLAFLQYPITFSQFARPYASGLFLGLLFVWLFTKGFLDSKNKWKNYIPFYVIVGVLNAYNHHFSLFFIGLVVISGIFLIQKDRIATYLLSNAFIVLLYLPNVGIFLTQLQKGGIESWLSKPNPVFFLDYAHYIFHFSTWLMGISLLIFCLSFFYIRKTIKNGNKYRLVMLSWLLATYATAYFYSVYRNAVLQYSVLLFTFPFLVILIFSFVGKLKNGMKWILVVLLGFVSVYSLVVERKHFQIQYQSVLEQTFAQTSKARNEYGAEQVACLTNIPQKVQQYYSVKYGVDPGSVIYFDSTVNYIELRETLQNHPGDYLAMAWVNITNLEVFSIAREVFPHVLEKNNYYTGDYYLLSRTRNQADSLYVDDRIHRIRTDSLTIYNYNKEKGYPMIFEHDRLLMPGWLSYAVFYEGLLSDLVVDPNNYILASVQVENPRGYESLLISEIRDGEQIDYWSANPTNLFTDSDWGRYRIHLALKLSDLDPSFRDHQLRFYLSNLDKEYYYINYFQLNVLQGNPLLYSLFEKIPK